MTCAASQFVAAIRRILEEIDTAISVAGVAGLGATGRITVGWYASLSSGELRATLLDYVDRYPVVVVRMVEGSRPRLAGWIEPSAMHAGDLAIKVVTVASSAGQTSYRSLPVASSVIR